MINQTQLMLVGVGAAAYYFLVYKEGKKASVNAGSSGTGVITTSDNVNGSDTVSGIIDLPDSLTSNNQATAAQLANSELGDAVVANVSETANNVSDTPAPHITAANVGGFGGLTQAQNQAVIDRVYNTKKPAINNAQQERQRRMGINYFPATENGVDNPAETGNVGMTERQKCEASGGTLTSWGVCLDPY